MKKLISFIIALCCLISLCSCSNEKIDVEETTIATTETHVSVNVDKDISKIKVAGSAKSEDILKQLGTISVKDVFEDIKNIDLFMSADIDGKVYSLKTVSGLDAEVKCYIYSGEHRTVVIETAKYKVSVNTVDESALFGASDTTIILLSSESKAPFDCSAKYYFDGNTATFENATFFDNGNYTRYSFSVDQYGKEDERTEILVKNYAPKISDNIIKALQTDKSYKYSAVLLKGANEWYCVSDKWFVKAKLGIVFDNNTKAEAYMKNNLLNGKVEDYGSATIVLDNVVLEISKNVLLKDDAFEEFITGDFDSKEFKKITLDSNGIIIKLDSAGIGIT